MVPAGYENYQLWMSLDEIKTKLGKGLEAAYAAYLATEIRARFSGRRRRPFWRSARRWSRSIAAAKRSTPMTRRSG